MNTVNLHTVGDLLAHKHTLGLYCLHCDRWSEAPLERLAQDGWALTPIARLRFRCHLCDGPAQRQLRPPMPIRDTSTGWMAPAAAAEPTAAAPGDAPSPGRRPRRALRFNPAWTRPPAVIPARGTSAWNITQVFI